MAVEEMAAFFIYAFTAVFVIVNPLNGLFTFLSMTRGFPEKMRQSFATKSVLLALFLALFFAMFGAFVLNLFGVSVDSIRIAGGILLFTVGFNMMRAKVNNNVSQTEISSADKDFWVFPIAIPLLCGPGTISTVIVLSGSSPDYWYTILLLIAIIIVFGVTYAVFHFSKTISKYISYTAMLVITRVFGLLLASIAVSMITTGLYNILYELMTIFFMR
ncbi:MAG: MarC family protein [Methanimicrococcus sp.]|nr:MarC family protein [Methanimicrococcus sp.]